MSDLYKFIVLNTYKLLNLKIHCRQTLGLKQ